MNRNDQERRSILHAAIPHSWVLIFLALACAYLAERDGWFR